MVGRTDLSDGELLFERLLEHFGRRPLLRSGRLRRLSVLLLAGGWWWALEDQLIVGLVVVAEHGGGRWRLGSSLHVQPRQ